MRYTTKFKFSITPLFLFFTFFKGVFGQEVPNVIPPSPESAAITSYTNNSVSYYTGNAQISIPIFEVKGNGIGLPINLSYSGSGGIRVEQMATWVGLGWTLNAGGAITRTVRGVRDDSLGVGYRYLSAIPSATSANIQDYVDFSNGTKDPEPDEFNYSVGGYSGSFYIKKDGSIFYKPLAEVEINVVYGSNGVIDQFILVAPTGEKYTFSAKESTRSKTVGDLHTNDFYTTSAWLLTKIENSSGTDNITLTYTSHHTENVTLSPLSIKVEGSGDFDVTRLETHHNVMMLSTISSGQHKVTFEKATSNRLDLYGGKYLKKIIIADTVNNPIKNFVFDYSYFSGSGAIAETGSTSISTYENQNTGDHTLRLRLDEVTEYNDLETESLPPYQFNYYTGHYLPSRYSFAQDHWGYYNGATGNTTLEPVYRLLSFSIEGDEQYNIFGSADREPVESYAKAGIMTEVVYPTGGSTKYNYELHDAEHPKLPNSTSFKDYSLSVDNSSTMYDQTITVNSSSQDFGLITVYGGSPPFNEEPVGEGCELVVLFYDDNDVKVVGKTLEMDNNNLSISLTTEAYLQSGTYNVIGKRVGCNVNSDYNLGVRYDDEIATNKKKVGGLRVKSIANKDGLGGQIVDNFYYDIDGDGTGSTSTGRISNAPKYGLSTVFNQSTDLSVIDWVNAGYRRTVTTAEPLTYTNGSVVGYGKVTVRRAGSGNMGKTEYYYSTHEDIPNYQVGIYSPGLTISDLGVDPSNAFPVPQIDDRDFLRGKLIKEIQYEYNGSSPVYKKVKETINDFTVLFAFPKDDSDSPSSVTYGNYDQHFENGSYSSIEGLRFVSGVQNHYKPYNLYTARLSLLKTTERVFDKGNDLLFTETIQENKYSPSDLNNGNFQTRGTKITNSNGEVSESTLYYSYHGNSLPVTASQKTVLSNMASANIIAMPVMTEEEEGSAIQKSLTLFSNPATGEFYPSEIQTAQGSTSFETRVEYVNYDSKGNFREVRQKDGTSTVYLWGYGSILPVAQIQNASWSDVSGVVNQTIIDDLTKTDEEVETELNKLRSATALKNALVTTMTYKLGVGMTSQTSPNGLTMYYEYDSFGRLEYIKDKDGNILKKNEYVYKVNANDTNN